MMEIKVKRYPRDPFAIRVSIGGREDTGYYCVYRGTREEAIRCIELALAKLQTIPEQKVEEVSFGKN